MGALVLADNGRGAHPKARPATSILYFPLDGNDETAARDIHSASIILDEGPWTPSLPQVIDTPIGGRGRRFVDGEGHFLWEPGTASLRDEFQGELTFECWIRVHEDTGANQNIFDYGGDAALNTAAENELFRVYLDSNRQPVVRWEYGSGTNVTGTFAPALELHRWYHLVIRKTNAAGAGSDPAAGPGGTVDVDLFLNGALVEGGSLDPSDSRYNATFAAMANTSDGTSANLSIGAIEASAALTGFASVDLAGVYVFDGALDQKEIEEDYRRGLMLPFYHRADVRALVEDGNGDLVDMSEVQGEDFLLGVSINSNVDQSAQSLDVTLRREVAGLSLALLKTDSSANLTDLDADPQAAGNYDPLVDVVRRIEAHTARVPLGVRATFRDFVPRLVGQIDEVDWGGSEEVKVRARDEGGVLIDTYIEQEVRSDTTGEGSVSKPQELPSYGSTIGAAVEGEMQQILDDNDNDGTNDTVSYPESLYARTGSYDPITLYTPKTPAWFVLPWRQRREPVMTALRALAAQIGWDLRYQWDANALAQRWRLTFNEPNREDPAPHILLRSGEVINAGRASITAQNIRNVVRVVYLTSETEGTNPTTAASAIDANFSEDYKNQGVDAEGNRTVAWYQVEDGASIARYGRRFMEVQESAGSQIDTIDEAQSFALAALRDLREPDFSHSLESIPLPELDFNSIVRVDSNVELYTGQQQLAATSVRHSFGATSKTSMELRGKPTVGFRRWLQLEARPGIARPPVIDPLDTLTDVNIGGVLQAFSALLNRSSYLTGGKFTEVRNSDFAFWTSGEGNAPDGWQSRGPSNVTESWGTSVEIEKSDTQTSNRAVRITSADGRILSDFVPIIAGAPYMGESTTKRTNAADSIVSLVVTFYQADRSTVAGTVTWSPTGFTGTNWENIRRAFEAPSSARFATVMAVAPGSMSGDILVDRLNIYRIAHECEVEKNAGQGVVAANAWELWEWDDDSSQQASGDGPHDYGGIANTTNHRIEIKEHGFYEFGFTISFLASGSGTLNTGVRIKRSGSVVAEVSGDSVYPATPATPRVRKTVSKAMHLEPGDYLEFEALLEDASGTYETSSRGWCKQRYTD